MAGGVSIFSSFDLAAGILNITTCGRSRRR